MYPAGLLGHDDRRPCTDPQWHAATDRNGSCIRTGRCRSASDWMRSRPHADCSTPVWSTMKGERNLPLIDRFRLRFTVTEDCWIWNGAPASNGYGKFGFNGKTVSAHRMSYEMFVGQIPPGLTIDHLCRVRLCVNPNHLEAVPHRVNILRSDGPAAKNAVKTHCDRGHAFTPENTRITNGTERVCRACRREDTARRRDIWHSMGLNGEGRPYRRQPALLREKP